MLVNGHGYRDGHMMWNRDRLRHVHDLRHVHNLRDLLYHRHLDRHWHGLWHVNHMWHWHILVHGERLWHRDMFGDGHDFVNVLDHLVHMTVRLPAVASSLSQCRSAKKRQKSGEGPHDALRYIRCIRRATRYTHNTLHTDRAPFVSSIKYPPTQRDNRSETRWQRRWF
ncbi:hypothetical protein BIW11_06463 [Tropilaelaps mercedesae]|uniref:Uncharacterized protein n=1 Tax=Tropilaelaps mercedesae TaxID=418985 RepID=A0A1V9XXX1_9ACAR|nr:hypothetical protein BIW11_06463 [Tropilaelaps mercedesae]